MCLKVCPCGHYLSQWLGRWKASGENGAVGTLLGIRQPSQVRRTTVIFSLCLSCCMCLARLCYGIRPWRLVLIPGITWWKCGVQCALCNSRNEITGLSTFSFKSSLLDRRPLHFAYSARSQREAVGAYEARMRVVSSQMWRELRKTFPTSQSCSLLVSLQGLILFHALCI